MKRDNRVCDCFVLKRCLDLLSGLITNGLTNRLTFHSTGKRGTNDLMRALYWLAMATAPLTLISCEKDDLATLYYLVAAVVGSALVGYLTRRYKKSYKAAMEAIAQKYNGQVVSFGGGAGANVELHGAHGGHRFTFRAEAEGNGSKLTLRITAHPTPPPIRLFVAAKAWWKPAAVTFGVDPGFGQPYQDFIFISEPPDVAAALFNKPGVHEHLQALHRSIPLSLFIGPKFVDYCLTFHGQKIQNQPKYYKEEILSWWIEAMVAFTAALEQE